MPNLPGVYYFYGSGDVLLYVGKSKQLRNRVLSHFSAAKYDSKERKLINSTHRIHFQLTCGELGALLLESQEIKRLRPLYNRRLRQQKRLYSWAASQQAGDQFYRLQLVLSHWPPMVGQQLLGLYAGVSQAKLALNKMAQSEGLCLKMMGVEKRQGACFAYQLGSCRGACVGSESAEDFNRRLVEAFVPQSIAAWPYEEAVVVTESATKHSKAAHHLIHQWHYLGQLDEPEKSTSEILRLLGQKKITQSDDVCNLDKDAYRILLGFLLSPQNNQLQIRKLSEL